MNFFTVMGRVRLKMVCSNFAEHPLYYLRSPFVTPWYRLRLKCIRIRERLPHQKSEWEQYLESIHTSEEENDYVKNED